MVTFRHLSVVQGQLGVCRTSASLQVPGVFVRSGGSLKSLNVDWWQPGTRWVSCLHCSGKAMRGLLLGHMSPLCDTGCQVLVCRCIAMDGSEPCSGL